MLVAFALFGIGFLLLVAWEPYMLRTLHYAMRINNNLPPICWRSRTAFRGW